jgi:hypothetical protein
LLPEHGALSIASVRSCPFGNRYRNTATLRPGAMLLITR